MGCPIANKDATVNSLCDWISKVKCKKVNCKLQRRKNLLVQAVLSRALSRAEMELRIKQQERRRKWECLKAQVARSCDYPQPDPWGEAICQEVNNSLDQFMSQVNLVKVSHG